ncbi:LOW QUALITY PROTEIN: hypothetical protein PRUPE_4G118700 [Prunus persica]|uniref:Cationic amino acid transporter C-terminal domain-containing protein n=1 Tax=Prunus persica TaxID=3760 RepID=A0A251PJ90_PRUPE|nr:LOW QUALITY PROTEIN: hypothetical protein PRUPE_4G118700 [Prunus persica]
MGSMGVVGEEVQPRSYCWSTYRTALSQTGYRFKNRLISRSDDNNEIGELPKRSENDMKRCLTWWDLIWFGFGSVIGAGIFVLTGQEIHDHAGPAIVLSYVASGVSAMLSVFSNTEFSVEVPVAELGDFIAFTTAGNILLEGIVGSAAIARSWTSYFTSLLNRPSNSLRIHTNLTEGFNLLDPIAVAVLTIAATIAMISTRKTSYLNWIASVVNNVVILFVIIAAFIHANPSNMKPFFPFGARGVFQAAAIVYLAYGGFDNIATMAEETKYPSRDIPIGLIGSMSIITVVYCLTAVSLPMMQKYTDIDPNVAYSVAFQSVGMTWAKYLVALGALKGMTTVLLVGTLGQARYITHIARAHMIPPWFALVHPKTGTPINASLDCHSKWLYCFVFELGCLGRSVIMSTLFIFMMMAVALLVRRYYVREITPQHHLLKRHFLLIIIASSMWTSAYWGLNPNGWVGYVVTVPLWFFGTLAMAVFLPQQRSPKVWGVSTGSLVAILVNCNKHFSYGLSGFGICTVVMLIYYVFFGLHATYDMAHKQDQPESLKVDDSNIREKAEP